MGGFTVPTINFEIKRKPTDDQKARPSLPSAYIRTAMPIPSSQPMPEQWITFFTPNSCVSASLVLGGSRVWDFQGQPKMVVSFLASLKNHTKTRFPQKSAPICFATACPVE